jgi:hypothetical protein
MTTAKARINAACRALGNPAESNADTKIGDMLEVMRAAFTEIQAASQLSDFAAFKAAMDSTATNLTLLADDGDYDLNEN